MSLLSDWRVLAIGAAVLWGFWGVFAKVATTRLDWRTALVYVNSTHCLLVLACTVWHAKWGFSRSHGAAIAGGVFAAAGAIFMYRALERASGSLVIAVSAQYVLVTALLSWMLLGEHLKPRRLLGIVLAVVAIVLLSWEEKPAPPPAAAQAAESPASGDGDVSSAPPSR